MNNPDDLELYSLQLLRLIAKHRGFTSAATESGISQSALSRQIQGLEAKLEVQLLERTTRKVSITEAGAILLRETEAIPNILSSALRRIKEECQDTPREIRVGLSNELALAHIPGIFRSHNAGSILVSQTTEPEILQRVAANGVDLGIVSRPKKLPPTVEVTHQITDDYCLIIPGADPLPNELPLWSKHQNWLLPPESNSSRSTIDSWIKKHRWKCEPKMQLENFDLMIQLVALGMGVAFVPRRAVSSFPRKHQLQRIELPTKMSRKLCILRPRFTRVPEHVDRFVKEVLFS